MHKFKFLSATARAQFMPVQPHPNAIDVGIVVTSQIAMRFHLLTNCAFESHQPNVFRQVEVQQVLHPIISLGSEFRNRIIGVLNRQSNDIMNSLDNIFRISKFWLFSLILALFILFFPPFVYWAGLAVYSKGYTLQQTTRVAMKTSRDRVNPIASPRTSRRLLALRL